MLRLHLQREQTFIHETGSGQIGGRDFNRSLLGRQKALWDVVLGFHFQISKKKKDLWDAFEMRCEGNNFF